MSDTSGTIQGAHFFVVAERKGFLMRGPDKPAPGKLGPRKSRKENRNKETFKTARRKVDREVSDIPVKGGLQMLGHVVYMPVVNILMFGLKDRPGFANKPRQCRASLFDFVSLLARLSGELSRRVLAQPFLAFLYRPRQPQVGVVDRVSRHQ